MTDHPEPDHLPPANPSPVDPSPADPQSDDPPLRRRRVEEACEAFLLSVDTPDASSLERIIERFPDCAAELTDFAVEWASQDLQPAAFDGGDEHWDEHSWDAESWDATPSPVEKAMDGLRRRLAAPADPFAQLATAELRRLASRVGLDTTLLAKIRHRRLLPETVPAKLVAAIAEALGLRAEAVTAHLEAPPLLPAAVSFKSQDQPAAETRQSFAEAIDSSSLDAEARRRWLDG